LAAISIERGIVDYTKHIRKRNIRKMSYLSL
jgi:hypothetical protein